MTTDGNWRKPGGINKTLGFPPLKANKEVMQDLIRRFSEEFPDPGPLWAVKTLPAPAYSDEEWAVLKKVVTLLPLTAANLKVVFQEEGEVDFQEVAEAALRSLSWDSGPTEQLLALDQSIEHILMDEFQDTSFNQMAILSALTSGWTPGDGRTLFLVGDPMQSIYRFREAEVALFLKTWEEGIGDLQLEPLTLTANFRAQQGLVQWVNQHFGGILPARSDWESGAVPFTPFTAQNPDLEGPAVTFHPIPALEGADPALGEARKIASLAGKYRERNLEVAILVRARTHLARILRTLREKRIPYQAQEIDPLAQRPAVEDLLALTRALLHPGDRTAWLAILRSPWCGLKLKSLLWLCQGGRGRPLWALLKEEERYECLAPGEKERLIRFREVMEKSLGEAYRLPLRQWVEGTWISLNGPACLEPFELEEAEVFLAMLEQTQKNGLYPTMEELVQGLDDLFAETHFQVEGDENPPVQVMTLHKAKGLEFEVVILPGLDRRIRPNREELLNWLELDRGLLLSPITAFGQDKGRIANYFRELEKKREAHETGRLLYVGVTRAKKYLHLFGRFKVDRETGGLDFRARPDTLLGHLLESGDFRDELPNLPISAESKAPEVSLFQATASLDTLPGRLPDGWRLETAPSSIEVSRKKLLAASELGTDEFPLTQAGEAARQVGTLTHASLARIAQEGIERWETRALEEWVPGIVRRAERLGLRKDEAREAAHQVLRMIQNILKDEKGRWILASHPEARVEWSLSGDWGGTLIHASIDRSFVTPDGTRWIIDYKTGFHQGGDLGAFLEAEVERYRPQLETYARLVQALEGRPVRLGLYFIAHLAWREWEVSPRD